MPMRSHADSHTNSARLDAAKVAYTSRTAISGPSPDDAAFIVHATDSFQCVNVCCACRLGGVIPFGHVVLQIVIVQWKFLQFNVLEGRSALFGTSSWHRCVRTLGG